MGVGVFTHGAMRSWRESGTGFGLVSALAGWLDGCGAPRRYRRASVRPSIVPQHPEPQESQDHQLGVKKVRHHGIAPLPDGVMGAL
jgi:hypothetical protein